MRKCRLKQCRTQIPAKKDCTDPITAGGFCGIECLSLHGREKAQAARERKAEREAKAKRAKHMDDKERIKTASQLKKEAQKAFNAFIRARDHDQPCISCDRSIQEIEGNDGWKPGGAWDCGHYLTVGGFEELRFVELNAHKQCKSCNAGAGKYTHKNQTVSKQYKERLIKRIGIEQVEWLEGPHEPNRYRADDYRRIRDEYRAKTRELKRNLS